MEKHSKNNELEKSESIDGLEYVCNNSFNELNVLGAISGGIIGMFSSCGAESKTGLAISALVGTIVGGFIGATTIGYFSNKINNTADYKITKSLILEIFEEQNKANLGLETEEVNEAFKRLRPIQIAGIYVEYMHGLLYGGSKPGEGELSITTDVVDTVHHAFRIKERVPKKYQDVAKKILKNYLYELPDEMLEPFEREFREVGTENYRLRKLGVMYFNQKEFKKAEDTFFQIKDRDCIKMVEDFYASAGDNRAALRIRNRLNAH